MYSLPDRMKKTQSKMDELECSTECFIRHFSVAPYITICPSTETYFGLYLRGAMSAVTGIYLFCLLLNFSNAKEIWSGHKIQA